MFQIEKESGFELSVLYSYPMRSAFSFISELKCVKRWHSDLISSVSHPNPSLLAVAVKPPYSYVQRNSWNKIFALPCVILNKLIVVLIGTNMIDTTLHCSSKHSFSLYLFNICLKKTKITFMAQRDRRLHKFS